MLKIKVSVKAYYNRKQVAELLGVKKEYLWELKADGLIFHFRNKLIRADQLFNWIEKRDEENGYQIDFALGVVR